MVVALCSLVYSISSRNDKRNGERKNIAFVCLLCKSFLDTIVQLVQQKSNSLKNACRDLG